MTQGACTMSWLCYSVWLLLTHTHSFSLLCVHYHAKLWRSQLVWQLFSLTGDSAHTLIVVCVDCFHSMWVCDAECQSFFNAAIISKCIWIGCRHHCGWIWDVLMLVWSMNAVHILTQFNCGLYTFYATMAANWCREGQIDSLGEKALWHK